VTGQDVVSYYCCFAAAAAAAAAVCVLRWRLPWHREKKLHFVQSSAPSRLDKLDF